MERESLKRVCDINNCMNWIEYSIKYLQTFKQLKLSSKYSLLDWHLVLGDVSRENLARGYIQLSARLKVIAATDVLIAPITPYVFRQYCLNFQ